MAIRWAPVLTLFFGAYAAAADTSPHEKPKSWDDFNVFNLTVAGPAPKDRSTFRGAASASSGDLRIDLTQVSAEGKRSGTMLVVAGRMLAVRGFELKPGVEIDALDTPVLYLRMLTGALGSAIPGGPPSVTQRIAVNHAEIKSSIRAGTPSAAAEIPPPWTLKGHVTSHGSGPIEFDLELAATTASKPGHSFKVHYTGSLAASASAPALPDATSLHGWRIYALGPRSFKKDGSTILDFGAARDARSHPTVGQLRRAVQEEEDPGKSDPKMDLNGFWKERCEQTFGLRIERPSAEAKYTITFCGPGGCGDRGRQSYITGDKRFQIISIDEIKERRGDGWMSYHRCAVASAAGR